VVLHRLDRLVRRRRRGGPASTARRPRRTLAAAAAAEAAEASGTGLRVTGVLGTILYDVVVTGIAEDPVVGSKRVRQFVEEHTGTTIRDGPHGPAYAVDPGDPASILGLLRQHTTVRSVGVWPER
jgi:hypothetical protein